MNNKELQELFQQILANHSNIFDIYIELQSWTAKYKTSSFYQKTKLTIIKAFEFYMNTVGGIEYTVTLFKNLNNSNMQDILDIITDRLSIDNILNMMDTDNKKLFTELLPYVHQ